MPSLLYIFALESSILFTLDIIISLLLSSSQPPRNSGRDLRAVAASCVLARTQATTTFFQALTLLPVLPQQWPNETPSRSKIPSSLRHSRHRRVLLVRAQRRLRPPRPTRPPRLPSIRTSLCPRRPSHLARPRPPNRATPRWTTRSSRRGWTTTCSGSGR